MSESTSLEPRAALVAACLALVGSVAVTVGLRAATTEEVKAGVPVLGRISIENIAPVRVLYRDLQGGYDKTQEAFADLKGVMMRFEASSSSGPPALAAAQPAALIADCLGIYPFDPDAVPKDSMSWGAAVIVPETAGFRRFRAPRRAAKLSVPASGYGLQTLPAIEAAVMYSTVGRSPQDGLKFFSWMAENGYVQVGPTRMLYFSDPSVDLLKATPEQIAATKTKIIVPITKREREISLTRD